MIEIYCQNVIIVGTCISRLTLVEFSVNDILAIIKNLDPNKAHGSDGISVKMIKLCGKSITMPLEIIFKNCISSGEFPAYWKVANVVPVHNKSSKQIVNNYRPISLLPIIGKIFEKIIFNNLYKYFHNNNLLSDKQSGFRPGDSCVNQIIDLLCMKSIKSLIQTLLW